LTVAVAIIGQPFVLQTSFSYPVDDFRFSTQHLVMPEQDTYQKLIRGMLIRHEGYRAKPYKCSAGYWTVGFGHNLEAKPIKGRTVGSIAAMPLTYQQYLDLLDKDIKDAEKDARKLVPNLDSLQPHQKAVIVDMAFNMGGKRLGTFKRFLAAVNKGDWPTAVKEMRDSKWYRQVGNRSRNLVAMIETGTTLA
jgi:lysozyme